MARREIDISEGRTIPWDGIVFGWAPMVPFVVGGLLALLAPPALAALAVTGTRIWAAAILLFLSGVRRGLSFRTEGGPKVRQIAAMLGFFLLGLAAMVTPPAVALPLLLVGYLGLALGDPVAAELGDAPLYFARLRPPQMSVALLGLLALAPTIYG